MSPAHAATRAERQANRRAQHAQHRGQHLGYVDNTRGWLDAEQRIADAEQRRGWGILVALLRRFLAIEGFDLAGLVAMELFLTVVPITIVGYATMLPGAGTRIGELYVRQLRLSGENAALVLQTFGNSVDLRTEYGTVWGILGFLVWGIPMALTVAKVFAKAWRLPEPGLLHQLWRGAVWFCLYLATTQASDLLEMGARRDVPHGIVAWLAGMLVGMVPLVLLWATSHPLLVPGARWNNQTMLMIGGVGALLNGPVLRIAEVAAFPTLMSWWHGFGPLGVAMTLLTWSLVQGVGWVVAACLGAVIVERRRPLGPDGNLVPLDEVLAAQGA